MREKQGLFIIVKKKKDNQEHVTTVKHIISLFTELTSRWNRQFHSYNRLTELSQQLPDQWNPKTTVPRKTTWWTIKKKKSLNELESIKTKGSAFSDHRTIKSVQVKYKKFKLRNWNKRLLNNMSESKTKIKNKFYNKNWMAMKIQHIKICRLVLKQCLKANYVKL